MAHRARCPVISTCWSTRMTGLPGLDRDARVPDALDLCELGFDLRVVIAERAERRAGLGGCALGETRDHLGVEFVRADSRCRLDSACRFSSSYPSTPVNSTSSFSAACAAGRPAEGRQDESDGCRAQGHEDQTRRRRRRCTAKAMIAINAMIAAKGSSRANEDSIRDPGEFAGRIDRIAEAARDRRRSLRGRPRSAHDPRSSRCLPRRSLSPSGPSPAVRP